ncbi:uncharacterized protein LOC119174142 isoform X2 [Rhipicephalus microplus]|uniref:uncharacterized protein LOC119174142 isoform X2 n=1 Tax=Rhipicephalus microplus TaxID=6941 RepID=UPI003F6BE696
MTEKRLQGNMKAPIHDRVVYSPYPSVEIPECSFYTLAKKQLLVNPDKLLLVSDVVSLTRKETLAHMERYAIGFRNNGVAPGDRICIHLENGVENLVAIYGCILTGATVVLAKPSLTENELRYQCEDSESTHILTEQKYAEKVVRTVVALSMKGLFCMGPAPGFISTSEFLNFHERDYLEVPVEKPRDTVLALIYTSGSTGLPKGTEITHYNYVAAFYCTTRHLPWSSSDIFLASFPITHQSGMMYTMLGALGGTISVITPATMTPQDFMDSIHKYKVVDVSTRDKLGPHQIGEICFRTPSMVRGYYKRPRESAELFDEEGWCKSGDAGFYDEDGRLYFSERLKQMIKCMDNQVAPSELEELLLRMHPTQIAEISVVGLKHSEYGEAPAAAIVLTEEGKKQNITALVNDVKATVANNLAVHKRLYGGVYIVDCLPKTETAKVNRPALARSLACQ